jgi:hypothetical protein
MNKLLKVYPRSKGQLVSIIFFSFSISDGTSYAFTNLNLDGKDVQDLGGVLETY